MGVGQSTPIDGRGSNPGSERNAPIPTGNSSVLRGSLDLYSNRTSIDQSTILSDDTGRRHSLWGFDIDASTASLSRYSTRSTTEERYSDSKTLAGSELSDCTASGAPDGKASSIPSQLQTVLESIQNTQQKLNIAVFGHVNCGRRKLVHALQGASGSARESGEMQRYRDPYDANLSWWDIPDTTETRQLLGREHAFDAVVVIRNPSSIGYTGSEYSREVIWYNKDTGVPVFVVHAPRVRESLQGDGWENWKEEMRMLLKRDVWRGSTREPLQTYLTDFNVLRRLRMHGGRKPAEDKEQMLDDEKFLVDLFVAATERRRWREPRSAQAVQSNTETAQA